MLSKEYRLQLLWLLWPYMIQNVPWKSSLLPCNLEVRTLIATAIWGKKGREADKNVLPISWTQKLAPFCSPCPFPSQFGMRQSCNPSQRCLHAERWCRPHAYQKVSSCRSAAPFHPTHRRNIPFFFAKSAILTQTRLWLSHMPQTLGPCKEKNKNNLTLWKLHVPPIYSIHSSRHLQEVQPTNPTPVLRPGITIWTNDKSRRYQTIMISTLRKDVNKIYHRAWHLQPSFCWFSASTKMCFETPRLAL